MEVRTAIDELLATYADAVTRRDPEELRWLFTEEGIWDLGPIGIHTGSAAIVNALTDLLRSWQVLVHVPHTRLLRFDPDDETTVFGRSYFSEFGLLESGESAHFAGVYHDTYSRDGDRWRFAERRYSGLYSRRGTEAAARDFPEDIPEVWR